ncbi:centrosomal AT-AC splicing factor [Bombina bombina]|uniref:centrosomal AT-AC splicing factor n=1 Tax=Bombina bombina TaxID=8345 RepID=UPI00235B2862|nr:centrosomal AT-AC splicing factor [Bombina bombina]
MAVYHCTVCRKSSFCGRRKHVYEKGHRERLAGILKTFSSKISAARKMIKGASVVKYSPSEHEGSFWCYCCDAEVKKHTTDGNQTVLFGGILEHMQSSEHVKAVNKFWWTHQAEKNLKPQFVLSSEEFERFKSSVTKALDNYEETEDVLIKQVAAQIRQVEENRMEILQSVLEPTTNPVEEEEAESAHVSSRKLEFNPEKAGPSRVHAMTLGSPPPTGVGPLLTFIGHQVLADNKLNVHTGALPPWLRLDEEEEEKQQEIGPSHADFIKHQEKQKLKKLPPNRVGANFDHSSATDEGWLPSFGRVWNSGRRWQSRHQYRSEAEEKGAKRKRREEDL